VYHKSGKEHFTERFQDLAELYGFTPRACRPPRARTKGKDECMVGYIAGRFPLIKLKLAIATPQITQTKGAGRTIPQVTESVSPCVMRAIWLHNKAAPIPVIKALWDVLPA